MEFVVSDKNYEYLNVLRKEIAESYLETKVEFSSYKRIGTDTQLFTIDIEEEIPENEKRELTKLFEIFNHHHKFLYRGYDVPIKQLKSMNEKYHKILNYRDVYYYDSRDLTPEMEEFSHIFVKRFRVNFEHIHIDEQQMSAFLGLEKMGLSAMKLDNTNGRLYLEVNNEKHLMNYEEMSDFVKQKMSESDLETHYNLQTKIDRINVDKILNGKSPISIYRPNDSTNYHVFRLTLAFAKICKKENLPMFNCRDIVSFSNDTIGYEYYTLRTIIKLRQEYQNINITSFRQHEFGYLENALAFAIYLGGLNIKHFIVSNNNLGIYTVCYVYSMLLDPYVNIDDMKTRVIEAYVGNFNTDKDHMENKKFKHMSIQELLRCVMVRDNLIFDKHNVQHVSPYDNKALPISYYETKGYQIYSIYNIGNIIKGIFNKVPIYDRHNLELRNVEIVVSNGDVTINNVKVSEEMEFNDTKRALKHICRIWKKGYFLNSFGLMYYLETGKFANQTIRAPEWFTFKNSNEHNFYKFLRFNDL